MRSGIHIAITVGFSQSTYTASEHDGFIQICAELLEGELGTGKESFTVTLSTDITGVRIARAPCIVEIVDNDSKRES